jgi:hypothetical protein
MGRTSAVAVTMGVIWLLGGVRGSAAQPPAPCEARNAMPAQLRPLSCPTATRIAQAMIRSATLRGLIDRIGQLQGIVYVEDGHHVNPQTRRVLAGALLHHVTIAGRHRVLRIKIADGSRDRPIATLAHELQHAIEVLEDPDATTGADIEALFRRIGVTSGADVMETHAAVEAGRTVARELADRAKARD